MEKAETISKVYFIAVNYNGFDFTENYIKSINDMEPLEGIRVEIIIVDNCSSPDEFSRLKLLESKVENLIIIRQEENIGYFKGLNKGIEAIKEKKSSLLVIGNNDLVFDKQFASQLRCINYDSKTLVIAPDIITKDGRRQNPHVIERVSHLEKIKASIYNYNYYIGQFLKLINSWVRRIRNKKMTIQKEYGRMRIKRGIGACYILTPIFFKHYTKLDDRVFMWGEEALLSNQIEKAGGYTFYEPSLKIVHHESASVSAIQSKKKYEITKQSYKIYKKYL